MHDYQLHFTKHAYKRYRQRVGSLKYNTIHARCQTALFLGRYQYGEGLIKLCGIWWGCYISERCIKLATCYGKKDYNMIAERRHAVQT